MTTEKPFNLVRWFAVSGLFWIGLISATSAFIVSSFLTEQMVQRDAVVSKDFIESIVQAENTWSYFVVRDQSQADDKLESFFTHVSRLPDVVRANVFSFDRSVLWSSDPDLIGRQVGPNPELEEALKGRLKVEFGTVGTGEKPEHANLDSDTKGTRFVESYIPIWDRKGEVVVGVVETYKLPNALFVAIERGRLLVWLSAILGGVLLYTTLFTIVRRADRIISEQQRTLIDFETMAAIGEMASAIAHGIRNPLAAIRSSAELVEEDDLDGARESAADIIVETERLDDWVCDLLLFARFDSDAADSVDINEIVRHNLEGFAQAMKRQGVALTLDAQEALPTVSAHAAPLGQALNCIFVNALDAMPGRGHLKVITRLDASEHNVAVDITDSGPGISSDTANSIFRPFFTTKPNGLGLGLGFARRIVARFGGTLDMASVEGQGTTFTICLPITSQGEG